MSFQLTQSLRNFVPEQFVILNFNNQETCFLWSDDVLIACPYESSENAMKERRHGQKKKIFAPGKIRDVLNSHGVTFVVCQTAGVHRLMENYTLGNLSRRGIGIICASPSNICILTPKNGTLWLVDKREKRNKALFNMSDHQNLLVLLLHADKTNRNLRRALSNQYHKQDCSLVVNDKTVYNVVNESANVIYSSDFNIIHISEFRKGLEIYGISFLTEVNTLIFAWAEEDNLKFDKIDVKPNIRALGGGICRNSHDSIWLIYSDDEKSYHGFKKLNSDEQYLTENDESFKCIRVYKNKSLVCLEKERTNENNWLLNADLSAVENYPVSESEVEEDITLNSNMVSDVDRILDEIHAKAKELEKVNAEFLKEQDLTKRINMFNLKRRIFMVPKIQIETFFGKTIVVADFQKQLPQNTQTILTLKLGERCLFSVKNVDSTGIIRLEVPSEMLTTKAEIRIDSIVVKTEKGSWCLIRDFVQDPQVKENKANLSKEQKNFVANKISVLKKLIRDNKVDMKVLSEMHKSVRRELGDI